MMNGLFEGNGQATQTWMPTLDTRETDDALVYAEQKIEGAKA